MSIPAAWRSAWRCKLDQRHGLYARAASGLRPYSGEIRERAVACADANETVRSIAQASPSDQSVVRDKIEEAEAGDRRRFAWQDRWSQEEGPIGRPMPIGCVSAFTPGHSLRAS